MWGSELIEAGMIGVFIKCFVALFVVLDSLGNLPLFFTLNNRYPEKRKHKNIREAVAIATAILLPFVFFGVLILNFFGITIPGFKIAGGIILFLIGLKIVLGVGGSKKEEYSDIAIVPMATPLIAGPATITTIILLTGIYGYAIPLIALIVNLIICFFLFSYSDEIIGVIGKQGSEVISKIFGMLLVAIAAEMIISGIAGFIASGVFAVA
ncbi:MAG: MarC family protein [archaeon]